MVMHQVKAELANAYAQVRRGGDALGESRAGDDDVVDVVCDDYDACSRRVVLSRVLTRVRVSCVCVRARE